MSINRAILLGNVGKDPEIRVGATGDRIASFSIATSENWKVKASGERKEATEWHTIVVFIRDLSRIFAKVCKDFEADLIECNGEDDHVHLLIVYPPQVALSKLVNSLKGVSSRLLREWRPEVAGRYKDGVLWSPSYFVASCGGAPLTVIAEYVKSQRETTGGRPRLPPRPEGRGFSRGKR